MQYVPQSWLDNSSALLASHNGDANVGGMFPSIDLSLYQLMPQ
jgi:hypothetical protein